MKSPSFSSFRHLMDLWDEAVDRSQIEEMIDGNNFVFFFKSKGDVYGAPEGSRLVFAKMKNPEDEPSGWLEEASFSAINFNKALSGERVKSIFTAKNLEEIDVIEKDKAVDELTKAAKNITNKNIETDLDDDEAEPPEEPSTPPTIIKVKEK